MDRRPALIALVVWFSNCHDGAGTDPGTSRPNEVATPSAPPATAPTSAPNRPPSAAFRLNPDPPRVAPQQPVSFNACDSADPDGDALRFSFDFGDGSGDADSGTPCRVEHAYERIGTYTATSCVADPSHAPECRSWEVEVTCAGARISVAQPGGGATLRSRTQVFGCTLWGCTARRVVFTSDDWTSSPAVGPQPPYEVDLDLCRVARRHTGSVGWHCVAVQPDGSTTRSGNSVYVPAYSCN
jgi:hypothetical protein